MNPAYITYIAGAFNKSLGATGHRSPTPPPIPADPGHPLPNDHVPRRREAPDLGRCQARNRCDDLFTTSIAQSDDATLFKPTHDESGCVQSEKGATLDANCPMSVQAQRIVGNSGCELPMTPHDAKIQGQ